MSTRYSRLASNVSCLQSLLLFVWSNRRFPMHSEYHRPPGDPDSGARERQERRFEQMRHDIEESRRPGRWKRIALLVLLLLIIVVALLVFGNIMRDFLP